MAFASMDISGLDQAAEDQDADVAAQVLVKQRKATLQVLQGVVDGTPVDTGRARGNWQVTNDRPATGETQRTDIGGGETMFAGIAASSSIRPFGVSWVANNVPYIEALEDGHSSQSRGFVAATVARVRDQFE